MEDELAGKVIMCQMTVPVPEGYLAVYYRAMEQVYRALANALQPRPSREETPATGADLEPIDWTDPENFRELRRELHDPASFALFDLTAEREGEWVHITEVWERCGRGTEGRGGMSSLSKIIKRQHRNKQWNWPVEREWGADGRPRYRMAPEVANAWRASADPQ